MNVAMPLPLADGHLRTAIERERRLGIAAVKRKLDIADMTRVSGFRFVTSDHRRITSFDGREMLVFVAFTYCRAVFAEDLA